MLDELKRENRFEENVIQMEEELVEAKNEMGGPILARWSDRLDNALDVLTPLEQELIHWLFIEGLTQAECATRATITTAGIKKRRERILKKLKMELV